MDAIAPKTPNMDRTLEQYDSKFRFVLLAAARAEQLVRGAEAKLEVNKEKPSRVAMEEFKRGLVEWNYGPPPEPEAEEAPGATAEAAAESPEV